MWNSQAVSVPSLRAPALESMTPAGRKYAQVNSSSRVQARLTGRPPAVDGDRHIDSVYLPGLVQSIHDLEAIFFNRKITIHSPAVNHNFSRTRFEANPSDRRRAGLTTCTGRPSMVENVVRSVSCRLTISSKLALSAATFRVTSSRTTIGTLYCRAISAIALCVEAGRPKKLTNSPRAPAS